MGCLQALEDRLSRKCSYITLEFNVEQEEL